MLFLIFLAVESKINIFISAIFPLLFYIFFERFALRDIIRWINTIVIFT